MTTYRLVFASICAAAVCMGLVSWASGQEVGSELQARIEQLIRELDADAFDTRERAERALVEIGQPAADALAIAAKDASPERSERAARVLKAIRKRGHGLVHLRTLRHDDLAGVVNLVLSPDGRFLYAPGWRSNSITIFRRDAVTGDIAHEATLADPELLNGVVHVRLNHDASLASATSFRSKSVCLLERRAEDGSLRVLATRRVGPDLDFRWPTDSIFSPDGKFLYTVDDQAGAVFVFAVDEGGKALNLVEKFTTADDSLTGVRNIAMHPSGKTLYATGSRAGTLVALTRDPASGKLAVRQVLQDGKDGVTSLTGSMCLAISSDGKSLYTTSGRFMGDQAVASWRIAEDGTLGKLQEFFGGEEGEIEDFSGGNILTLSPDGNNLYASGTTSCSVAIFARDSANGKLEYQSTLQSEATGHGSTLGANGIALSSDGRFLYLALEDASAISIFERKH